MYVFVVWFTQYLHTNVVMFIVHSDICYKHVVFFSLKNTLTYAMIDKHDGCWFD